MYHGWLKQSEVHTLAAAADADVILTAIRALGEVATESHAIDESQSDGDELLALTLEAVEFLDPRAVIYYHRIAHCNKNMVSWLQKLGSYGSTDVHYISALLLAFLPAEPVLVGDWSEAQDACFHKFWRHGGGFNVFRTILQCIADVDKVRPTQDSSRSKMH